MQIIVASMARMASQWSPVDHSWFSPYFLLHLLRQNVQSRRLRRRAVDLSFHIFVSQAARETSREASQHSPPTLARPEVVGLW